MAKRKDQFLPWPDGVWHTRGRAQAGVLADIRRTLEAGQASGRVLHWREFTPTQEGDGLQRESGFDATWRMPDGSRIKARLVVRSDGMSPAVETFWALTAETDQPWNGEWRTPLLTFFPSETPLTDWVVGALPLDRPTRFAAPTQESLECLLDELAACPWYITVLSHDRRPQDEAVGAEMPLLSALPSSLQGRVVEIRLRGDQDRIANPVLEQHRVCLPWDGAVILPTRPRKERWKTEEYSIRRPRGATVDGLVKEVAVAVAQYAQLPEHLCARTRTRLDDLRQNWVLPEIPQAPQRVLEDLERSRRAELELRERVTSLKALLEDAQARNRRLDEQAAADREVLRELQGSLLEDPLAKRATWALQQAEDAWAAQEGVLDEVDRLAGEVAWLRRQLAQVPGRSYGESAPERTEGPASWTELVELAGELLPKVRIGAEAAPMEKLRGHVKEKTWLRRTWTALEAYQAYADARAEHGPQVLPHMQAYLQWPDATVLFPLSWHASGEATVLRRGEARTKEVRTFEVPGLGAVFMGEHVRIDLGRPPAPRMHVYDDTCGPTGLVHVGYIGPHLPHGRNV
ncbi:coiled-coil domain-containing protein [Streptomyces griseoaurantiacus]|uniref:hypothetical protein n=1 Tax=Streptomyces griseoaurantiacus TaxID=68213 RepID=UPI0036C5BA30